jgi:hypothetical protein
MFFLSNGSSAQSVLAPISGDFRHQIDRLTLLNDSFSHNLHLSFQPFDRQEIQVVLDRYRPKSSQDEFNREQLMLDQFLWTDSTVPASNRPILNTVYRTPAAFYHVKTSDFRLRIDPVLHFEGQWTSSDSVSLFKNTRGFSVSGSIGNKLGFHSTVSENQMRYPTYLTTDYLNDESVPGTVFYKRFGDKAFDFFRATGYVTFRPIKPIQIQFGHDQNFIGNGVRSLILSNHAAPHLFLKARTRIWKLQYTNLWSQLSDLDRQNASGNGQRPKYSATHHLSINVHRKLNIGLFETIIQGSDSNETIRPDLNYYNPIVFYRAIEQGRNSRHNVLLGADFQWLVTSGLSIYGQVVLDEFVYKELLQRTGWWANKWGLQGGVKYLNAFGVHNLDLQAEINTVRPYTYTHFDRSQNYIHHNQPMAHPLGANFREMIGQIRYQFLPKTNLVLRYQNDFQGLDSTSGVYNYGGSILNTYNNRPGDYDIQIGNGVQSNTQILEVRLSQWIRTGLYVDGVVRWRSQEVKETGLSRNDLWYGIGVRLNSYFSFPER